jgi:DNA-binding NarL/FixJ family response regulator
VKDPDIDKWLSPREKQVLGGLVDGMTCGEIARWQYRTEATIRTQIQSILIKLCVNTTGAAVAIANRAGWKARNPIRVAEQRGIVVLSDAS